MAFHWWEQVWCVAWCVCVVIVYRCLYMTMRVCAHKGQGDAGFQLPYFSHCFWNELPHWMQTSSVRPGWLTSELQGSSCFSPLPAVARVTDVCCCTLRLHVCWGSGLGSSSLCKKCLPGEPPPSPLKPVFLQRPGAFTEDSRVLQECKQREACPSPCLPFSSGASFSHLL